MKNLDKQLDQVYRPEQATGHLDRYIGNQVKYDLYRQSRRQTGYIGRNLKI